MSKETEASMDFKKLDVQLRNLLTDTRRQTFKIVTLCVKLHNHSAGYAQALGITPHEAIRKLKDYLKDYGGDLPNAVILLTMFPKEEQWAGMAFADMMTEMRRKIDEDRLRDRVRRTPVQRSLVPPTKKPVGTVAAGSDQAPAVSGNSAAVVTQNKPDAALAKVATGGSPSVFQDKQRTRRTATVAQLSEAIQETKEKEVALTIRDLEMERLKSKITQQDGEIKRLRAEVAKLKKQNAELRKNQLEPAMA